MSRQLVWTSILYGDMKLFNSVCFKLIAVLNTVYSTRYNTNIEVNFMKTIITIIITIIRIIKTTKQAIDGPSTLLSLEHEIDQSRCIPDKDQ